jgi:hypothetical protein
MNSGQRTVESEGRNAPPRPPGKWWPKAGWRENPEVDESYGFVGRLFAMWVEVLVDRSEAKLHQADMSLPASRLGRVPETPCMGMTRETAALSGGVD